MKPAQGKSVSLATNKGKAYHFPHRNGKRKEPITDNAKAISMMGRTAHTKKVNAEIQHKNFQARNRPK